MRKHIFIPNLLIVCVALVVSAIFFISHPDSDTVINDEAVYAEVPTVGEQQTPRAATTTDNISIPILVYHIVRPSYPTDSAGVRAIGLTPENFDAEMRYLKDAGYQIVTFADLEAYFHAGTPLPEKPVILSFDDGWSDQYTYAFPILKKYQLSVTFFVFTNSIGRKGFFSWDQLREMLYAGMVIGSHSRSHPYLTSITDPAKLWNEINQSKQILEKQLGVTIKEFAYPFGQYNDAIIADVKRAGYLSARGDFYKYKGMQSAGLLYELNAMNAPTTTALFAKKFPTL